MNGRCSWWWAVLLLLSTSALALDQQAKLDGTVPVRINGVAEASVLKVPFYVAALYVETPSSDPERLLEPTQARRMVFRFRARFSRTQWIRYVREQVAINAPKQTVQASLDALNRFLDMFQGALKTGDELLIDVMPGKGIRVTLDNQELGRIKDERLFNVLLSLWIGPRPPSADFKAAILANQVQDKAARAFDEIAYSEKRQGEIARWALRARLAEADRNIEKPAEQKQEATQQAEQPPKQAAGKKPAVDEQKNVKDLASSKATSKGGSGKGSPRKAAPPSQDTTRPNQSVSASSKIPAANQSAIGANKKKAADKKAGSGEALAKPKVVSQPKPPRPVTEGKAKPITLSDDEIKALEETYQEAVIDQILDKKTYPYQAMKRSYNKRSALANRHVVVTIGITLDNKGQVLDRQVIASSGERILDRAALKLVEEAAPFPAFPKLYPGKKMTIQVRVPYTIR